MGGRVGRTNAFCSGWSCFYSILTVVGDTCSELFLIKLLNIDFLVLLLVKLTVYLPAVCEFGSTIFTLLLTLLIGGGGTILLLGLNVLLLLLKGL